MTFDETGRPSGTVTIEGECWDQDSGCKVTQIDGRDVAMCTTTGAFVEYGAAIDVPVFHGLAPRVGLWLVLGMSAVIVLNRPRHLFSRA